MKSRSALQTGLLKGGEYAKRLIASKDKKGTAIGIGKEIGQGLVQKGLEKIHETDNLHVEDAMANPSTTTISKNDVHRYADSRDRIPSTLEKAWSSLPNHEKVPNNPPTFFGKDLGGKTANKDSIISKINQQFAKLGLRFAQLIGGEKGVKTIEDIMSQVFGVATKAIPGKFDDKIVNKVKQLVTSIVNYIAKSSNMVALIKAYRLSMIELYFDVLNHLHDNNTDKYEEIMSTAREWLDLWGISTGPFTDTDTVYKYLKQGDENIKDFVAAIAYSETIQMILFGDEPNVLTGKNWWKQFTSEAIDAAKEAAEDGTIKLSGKEERAFNKGKWPYLAEQI